MRKKLLMLITSLLLLGGIAGCISTEKNEATSIEEQNSSPMCHLSANVTSGFRPLNVEFYLFANDSDGNISYWELDIDNDGSVEYFGYGQPPSTVHHIYQELINDYAILVVEDNNGSRNTSKVHIIVRIILLLQKYLRILQLEKLH